MRLDIRRFTPIIVCRFILNLRQVESTESSSASNGQPVSLRFVGNAGELLKSGAEEDILRDETTSEERSVDTARNDNANDNTYA